ncbi:hypothetical protein ACPTHA_08230 [Enterococcus faecalis]|uniref:hypothetical protein n=1 Tax=Enterococcus faecalis TaxID=1351 RepID=UPI00118F5132|nr:hypothetical protein [Enterococcus faecalis]MDB1596534.1 hypothetical protein [Enterococcus faecalis]MDB1604842.1 hypothetical protein [Enterococcus faecalis]MDB1607331.1 hypothetical protein [Enterococcus faecalis]MDB1609385.1 hypothetical protein [Enterococcus faecalis]VFU86495.1 hypothetical protein B02_01428 [Enterococcus faecalis]
MNEMNLSLILAIITLVGVIYSIKEKEIVLGLYSLAILLLVLIKIIYYLTIE